ncbi:NAD-P-binding protein [Trametopsis cervina]|nr:NAD-P-binding protein [Trametopsis cervina]
MIFLGTHEVPPTCIWVITGSNSGLGLAIAEHVLSQGDTVIATVRSMEKFPASLRDGGARPLILDLESSDEDIRRAAVEAIGIFGRVDVLVNNAGTNSAVGPIEEIGMDAVRQQFQQNFFGALAFTQPFIAHFRLQHSGHILNISSIGSYMNRAALGVYSGSKSAFDSVSEALATEVAPYGVRVYIIMPGYFPTNIFSSHPQYTPDHPDDEGTPVAPGLSKVYTLESQGYNIINRIPRIMRAVGKGGDSAKLARRLYEIVTDSGIAKEIRLKEQRWIRIPMGQDGGEAILQKLEANLEGFKDTEPIWRSTDTAEAEL